MAGVLFVHNNFPGQFGFIAEEMRRRGEPCAAIASPNARGVEGVPMVRWSGRRPTRGIFPPAEQIEIDMIRGHAAAEQARALKAQGFDPDLIIGHPGWGETLFLGDVFPAAKQILYGEFYYSPQGVDVGFDPEFGAVSVDTQVKVRARNAGIALAYAQADRIVSATPYQKSLLPSAFQARTEVIHEGIDTQRVRPDPDARLEFRSGRVLDRSTPVITFINRHLEPLRGFHIFLRALPAVLAAVPEAEVVLIGAEEAGGYGQPPPQGRTWKQIFMAELAGRLDPARLHFTGRVPYDRMLAALSVSAAHVYYTYPFVLSWSLLEAMASECAVLASDTAPVRDAVTDGVDGRLLDFFDVEALSDALIQACRDPGAFAAMRRQARERVEARYDRDRLCRPAWLDLIADVRRA